MRVFLWLIVGLLAFGLLVLVASGIRVFRAFRRFAMVHGWLEDYLSDRIETVRTRAGALRAVGKGRSREQ